MAVELILHDWYVHSYPESYLQSVLIALYPEIVRDRTGRYIRGASVRVESGPGKRGFTLRLWIFEGRVPPPRVVESLGPSLWLIEKEYGWAGEEAKRLRGRLEEIVLELEMPAGVAGRVKARSKPVRNAAPAARKKGET